MAVNETERVGGNGGQDWCKNIESRCEQIKTVIEESAVGYENEVCFSTDDTWLQSLCLNNFGCYGLMAKCSEEPPVLTPLTKIEEEKLGESGQYHDVASFFEISFDIINDYLKPPSTVDDSIDILYFASGNHIAPLELGFQILKNTEYGKVNFTYTEIDQSYYKDIYVELNMLEQQDIISDLKQKIGKKTDTHTEFITSFEYKTSSGETKNIKLTFVLGKIVDGEYPPYFRQKDYDKADVIIAFDAEDSDTTLKYLNLAHEKSKGEDMSKTFIMENRKDYVSWSKKNGENILDNYSQHFGCEFSKKENGLGFRPIVFKIK